MLCFYYSAADFHRLPSFLTSSFEYTYWLQDDMVSILENQRGKKLA